MLPSWGGVPPAKRPEQEVSGQLFSRLFKSIYNSRPLQLRYTGTWEVSSVLEYLSNMGENSDLSLKWLSGKLALALETASHSSELHSLDLRFRVNKSEGVLLSIKCQFSNQPKPFMDR